ncbi:MAG: hypothetical protein ACK4TK_01585 [Thiobacillaceae bacterium]
MQDVRDYLARLFAAVFLCPVAVGVWIAFIAAGFDFGGFLALLSDIHSYYVGLDAQGQLIFKLEVIGGWAALALGFMFLSYLTNPPRFSYRLEKKGDQWVTDVIRQ